MSNNHTPTPWYLAGQATIRYDHTDGHGSGWIGSISWRNRKANAEFIVRACNTHDELVEALHNARGLLKAVSAPDDPIFSVAIADADADAALAKAEGKQ